MARAPGTPRDDHQRGDHVPDQRRKSMLVGPGADADPLEQIRSTPGVAARHMTPGSSWFVQGTALQLPGGYVTDR